MGFLERASSVNRNAGWALLGYPGLLVEDARSQRDAEGAVLVWTPRPGFVVTRAAGKMTLARAKIVEETADDVLRRARRSTAFHDWEELTDYEIEARIRLVAAGVRNRAAATVHMLVRNRLVFAAAEAAQMILKNLRVYQTRGSFEAALFANIARPSGLA